MSEAIGSVQRNAFQRHAVLAAGQRQRSSARLRDCSRSLIPIERLLPLQEYQGGPPHQPSLTCLRPATFVHWACQATSTVHCSGHTKWLSSSQFSAIIGADKLDYHRDSFRISLVPTSSILIETVFGDHRCRHARLLSRPFSKIVGADKLDSYRNSVR